MRAIVVREFGDPTVMNIEDIEDPTAGPGQVVVRMKAVGVNPVDTYIRSGQYASLPALPYTPGADGAGLVEAVGSGVKRLAAGDRVYVSGTASGRAAGAYAEKAVCTPDQVHPLPAHLSFAQGAGIGVPYVTAWRALFDKGRATAGETVLVHGASGGVGTAAVEIARAAGMRVFGTAGTDRGRQLVLQQGAHEVFDHASPDYPNAIMAQTDGRGVDLVIEMLANVNLIRDLELVAVRGRVVIVGNRGALQFNPRSIMSKDAVVTGLVAWNATSAELATAHAAIGAGLERSGFSPQVGMELPLSEAPRAHEEVMTPGAYGKIVLLT